LKQSNTFYSLKPVASTRKTAIKQNSFLKRAYEQAHGKPIPRKRKKNRSSTLLKKRKSWSNWKFKSFRITMRSLKKTMTTMMKRTAKTTASSKRLVLAQ